MLVNVVFGQEGIIINGTLNIPVMQTAVAPPGNRKGAIAWLEAEAAGAGMPEGFYVFDETGNWVQPGGAAPTPPTLDDVLTAGNTSHQNATVATLTAQGLTGSTTSIVQAAPEGIGAAAALVATQLTPSNKVAYLNLAPNSPSLGGLLAAYIVTPATDDSRFGIMDADSGAQILSVDSTFASWQRALITNSQMRAGQLIPFTFAPSVMTWDSSYDGRTLDDEGRATIYNFTTSTDMTIYLPPLVSLDITGNNADRKAMYWLKYASGTGNITVLPNPGDTAIIDNRPANDGPTLGFVGACLYIYTDGTNWFTFSNIIS